MPQPTSGRAPQGARPSRVRRLAASSGSIATEPAKELGSGFAAAAYESGLALLTRSVLRRRA